MTLFRNVIIAVTILVAMAACDGRIDRYSNFVQLSESGWAYGDTIKFIATGNTLTDAATMSVAVRHNEKFLYRNLWLELRYCDSVGNIYVDSVNLELADAYGRWNGSGIGEAYQCATRLPHAVRVADSTEISVRHIMRLDTVKGIEQIGVTIE